MVGGGNGSGRPPATGPSGVFTAVGPGVVIPQMLSGLFSLEDLRSMNPGVSDATLRQVLRELKAEGAIVPEGRGRGAKWRRVGRPD